MKLIQIYVRYVDIILSKFYESPKEMNFAGSHYYRINHILMLFVTLWPYERSIFTKITRIFILATVGSSALVQITPFLTFEYSTDFFIMSISYILINFLSLIQYYFFYVNSDNIKQIWKNICENWNNLKDKGEYNIMRQYSYNGELNTILVISLLTMVFGAYGFLHFLPFVLDIILPLNEPRPHNIYALTEYFVDSEKYYYPILLHWLLAVFFGGAIIVASWSFILIYIYHICGLLKIVGYRIKHLMEDNTIRIPEKKDHISLQRLRDVVDLHRTALKYADLLQSTIESIIMIICIIGAASLCLNWLRLIRAIISRNINDIFPTMSLVIGHFSFMFIYTYYGQQITNHNNEIFENVYNVQWYIATIKIQKLLLFIMKQTAKEYSLNLGSVITASIEDFAKFSKVSISYLMIIYSLMKE